MVRVSKETRRSWDDSVPRTSSASCSYQLVKEFDCEPEELKRFDGFESSWTGSIPAM